MKFWDASAVIPLCLQEAMSDRVLEILRSDQAMVVWWSTPVECHSALARLRREDLLTQEEADRAARILKELEHVWAEILPGERVRREARRLLYIHPLRAADALQLAAALVWCGHDPEGREMVCLDRRLREAAQREGFRVIPETMEG